MTLPAQDLDRTEPVSGPPPAPPGQGSAWWIAGLAALVAAAAIMAVDPLSVTRAVEVWLESKTYNHCFLILPICVYLLWERRQVFARVDPAPFPLALVAILPVALFWTAARIAGILEFQQFALIGMAQIAFFAVLGPHAYRALMFPLLYAFFLVPSGEYLVHPLQDFTAAFAVAGLKLSGIPVYSDGILIEIPAGNFVVAEACAGLRFLIASIAYGVLYAGLMYTAWSKRLVFVLASIVVPIFANGLRAYGLIMLAHFTNDQAAVDADHIIYGWGFFAFVTILLTLAGLKFADRAPPRIPVFRAAPRPAVAYVGTAFVAFVLAAAAPSWLGWRDLQSDAARAPALDLPAVPGWRQGPLAAAFPLAVQQPHAEAAATYRAGEASVDLMVDYFVRQSVTRKVPNTLIGLADETRWRRAETGLATVDVGGTPTAFVTERLLGGRGGRLVWSAFWINGKFVTSPLQAKIERMRAELLGGTAAAAVVVLSAPYGADPAEAEETLTAFAGRLGDLRPTLAAAAGQGAR